MTKRGGLRFSAARCRALFLKECRQILRDPSSLVIGLFLPIFMLLIYGYGISLDMRHIPTAVVLEDRSLTARRIAVDLTANQHFRTEVFHSSQAAESAFENRAVELVLTIPRGFTADLMNGRQALMGLTVYGVDSQSALLFKTYVEGVIQTSIAKQQKSGLIDIDESALAQALPVKNLVSRSWFNEGMISTWYIVPGLFVLVTGIAGGLMCAIVVAREWERGTMSALFATPASALEIFLSKWLPYWVVTFLGSLLCLIVAQTLFEVPLRGSLFALLVMLGLLSGWSSVLGLFLSAKTKSQFLATEATVVLAFLPSLMLSGFLFDLRSVPEWIEVVGRLLPPTYAMEALKQIFLAGVGPLVWQNACILVGWITLAALATIRMLQKRSFPRRPKSTALTKEAS